MPRKLPGPLVDGLLFVAEAFAQASGASGYRQASMRRAVSSACDAVFHALNTLCADGLIGGSRAGSLPPIDRSLEHGVALRKLRNREVKLIDPAIERVGSLFESLHGNRHAADDAPPSALFSRMQALALIDEARDAITRIEGLDPKASLERALLPLARTRAG
ncbi:hypothetical protein [Methylobacterium sp. Leaf118]|uniref:hypothetical protein n=1 Tax=Methylobacterium sp. Leaf118 TaxID=2876562 RepID=UPI001E618CE8|nr:hypothetical protein [Methylobacterium sp. Leaf118]